MQQSQVNYWESLGLGASKPGQGSSWEIGYSMVTRVGKGPRPSTCLARSDTLSSLRFPKRLLRGSTD